MYKVLKVEGGYHVFWIDGDQKIIADGRLKPYPSRQNAYKRCKQLNDERKNYVIRIAKVKVSIQKEDHVEVNKAIYDLFGGITRYLLDPTPTGSESQEREILFWREVGRMPDEDLDEQDPITDASVLYERLRKLKEHPKVLGIYCNYDGLPANF